MDFSRRQCGILTDAHVAVVQCCGGAVAAPAHSLTAHVHERRGRAPVAEWLAISILDSIYERARRSRSPTRRGGLTAAARATCAHLSPPPHHQEPDGTPKQNGQQRTCRECSRHWSAPYIDEGRRAPGRPALATVYSQHLTHAPKSQPQSIKMMIYDGPMMRSTRTQALFFLLE